MMIHSLQDPKLPTDIFECHGEKMTYVSAVERGLVTLTLNDAGEIVHLTILNSGAEGFVSPNGELPGYPGTIVKQS